MWLRPRGLWRPGTRSEERRSDRSVHADQRWHLHPTTPATQAGAFWPGALPAGAARPLARQLRVFSAAQEPGRAPDTPQLPPPTAADLLRDSRLAALSGALCRHCGRLPGAAVPDQGHGMVACWLVCARLDALAAAGLLPPPSLPQACATCRQMTWRAGWRRTTSSWCPMA